MTNRALLCHNRHLKGLHITLEEGGRVLSSRQSDFVAVFDIAMRLPEALGLKIWRAAMTMRSAQHGHRLINSCRLWWGVDLAVGIFSG